MVWGPLSSLHSWKRCFKFSTSKEPSATISNAKKLNQYLLLGDLGILDSLAGPGFSKPAVSDAIADDFEANFDESGVTDLGYNFLTIGGGVERFLALAFSKVAANALKAGDLPLTRTRSGLKDMLLERCDFSGTLDLPP